MATEIEVADLKSKLRMAREMIEVSEVHNNAMAAQIQKLRAALREIMRHGTGPQGNSVEATIAYEALGEYETTS